MGAVLKEIMWDKDEYFKGISIVKIIALIKINNDGLSKYIGDNAFNIRVSLSLSNFSLKISLLKNSFCFDKFPKIKINKIKVDGDDKRISRLIGNAINMLLNEY